MVEARFVPEFVPSDGGRRITIPRQYCEKVLWICGEQVLSVWLLVIFPGRFRLLSDTEVSQHKPLSEIRSLIVDGSTRDSSGSIIECDTSQRAARIGRLIPTTLAPPPPSWRLIIPKAVTAHSKGDQRFVLLISQGYLEIWLPHTYEAALAYPLDEVLEDLA